MHDNKNLTKKNVTEIKFFGVKTYSCVIKIMSSFTSFANFEQIFLHRYGSSDLHEQFIKLFPIAQQQWEIALKEKGGYTVETMNEDMLANIDTFLLEYKNIPVTEENLKILLARFYQSTLNDFIVNIDVRQRHAKIKDEKLWRKLSVPWQQLNSRDEQVSETARGSQIFGGSGGQPKVANRFGKEFMEVVTGKNIPQIDTRPHFRDFIKSSEQSLRTFETNGKNTHPKWEFAAKAEYWPKAYNNK